MDPFIPWHDTALTLASLLTTGLGAWVLLDLARRARRPPRALLVAGALAMGTGLWSVYSVGLQARSTGLTPEPMTLLSWAAGVAACAVVLWIARGAATMPRLAGGALCVGLGVWLLHGAGSAAVPGSDATGVPGGEVSGVAGLLLLGTAAALLGMVLWGSALEARMQHRVTRFVRSLKRAHVRLRSAHAALRRHTYTDALTGLPNRLFFEEHLGGVTAQASRLAVLYVDLDRFRPINDSYGRAAGDVMLKEVASRLSRVASGKHLVARAGGDGFLLLTRDAANPADHELLARHLIMAVEEPINVRGQPVSISATIGIALYPEHGQADELVGHADTAMHAAKRQGGRRHAFFEPRMEGEAQQQFSLINDLRKAIERGQLSLHYQPKIDGRRGQIRGVEALLRWCHPERGFVSPAVFIPLAERFGLIDALGDWVIDEACRQMQAWADDGVRMRVAINVSAHQLRQGDLVARIERALDRYHVEASQLLCEITESVAMDDIQSAQQAFQGLQRIGVYLSIDDFGTGYSSLAYLRQLPAKQIKIDRSFVNDLEASHDARAIVDAVIRLAHALGLRVVAEGVETAGQRDALLQLGCDELQGYFFAKPMPADALRDWAGGRKPAGAVDFSPSIVDEPSVA